MAKAKSTKTKVTAADVRALTDDQIAKRTIEIAKEKMNLRFQKAGGQTPSVKTQRALRKENAQLKTEQSARRLQKKA